MITPIRGWLLLLCILLTMWNPAALAVVAASQVGGAGTTMLALTLLGIRLVVTSVGVAAGLALWHRRPGAVTLAKASLTFSTLEAIGRLATRSGLSEAPPGTRLPLALALICYNGAWYMYLEKSRRVRSTYGLESPPQNSY